MFAVEIAEGLLRWTAPHPEWDPNAPPGGSEDWEQQVGCVLYELPDRVALIDPLLPTEERARFLGWLDERIAARPVSILTTIRWHRRDREELTARYAPNTPGAWNALPTGIKPRPLRGAGETMFWLEREKALVSGDRLVTDRDGALSLCPESWLTEVKVRRRSELAQLMRPLLELQIERVLVSHGQPVLRDGRAALVHAIAQGS